LELTPALTPAVEDGFSSQIQAGNQNENPLENHSFPRYAILAQADFPYSSPASRCGVGSAWPDGENGHQTASLAEPSQDCLGTRQIDTAAPPDLPSKGLDVRESMAGRAAVASLVCPLKKNDGRGACAEAPEDSARAPPPGLSRDACALLDHLAVSGPTTYGAAASRIGLGATQAWKAEAELKAAGMIHYDGFGRAVLCPLPAASAPPLGGAARATGT